MKLKNMGFTLVELVMVIVILSILAAIVMPKFLSMGKDSRLAALDTAKGAVISAANAAYLKCQSNPSCDVTAKTSTMTDNGVTYTLNYGYPNDGNMGASINGIDKLVDSAGFDVYFEYGQGAVFELQSAPNKKACRVVYAANPCCNAKFVLRVDDTGC